MKVATAKGFHHHHSHRPTLAGGWLGSSWQWSRGIGYRSKLKVKQCGKLGLEINTQLFNPCVCLVSDWASGVSMDIQVLTLHTIEPFSPLGVHSFTSALAISGNMWRELRHIRHVCEYVDMLQPVIMLCKIQNEFQFLFYCPVDKDVTDVVFDERFNCSLGSFVIADSICEVREWRKNFFIEISMDLCSFKKNIFSPCFCRFRVLSKMQKYFRDKPPPSVHLLSVRARRRLNHLLPVERKITAWLREEFNSGELWPAIFASHFPLAARPLLWGNREHEGDAQEAAVTAAHWNAN